MMSWRLIALCMLVGLTGCASQPLPLKTYEGAVRPEQELVLVNVPEQIEVMAIDGQEPPPSFLKSRVQLALLPGEHVFSLRYVQLFQINSDEHEVVRSKQAALRFNASAGSVWRLEAPAQKSVETARKFAKNPQFMLINMADKSVVESAAIKSVAEASLIDTLGKAFSQGDEPVKPSSNLDLLKDVWSRSSADDKAAFRLWMDSQGK